MKVDNQSLILFIISFVLGYMLSACIHNKSSMGQLLPKFGKSSVTYVVFGTMSCPYTVKQVDALKSANMPYKFHSTETPEGQNLMMRVTRGEQTGVPVTYNPQTQKHNVGFLPVDELVRTLA